MSLPARFERARKIADAVLYEGYVLYPYRASARKNQIRWQFGVIAPRAWSEAGGCESWFTQTECLLDGEPNALDGKIRCLQIRRRSVEERLASGAFRAVPSLDVEGRLWTSWEEGVEREIDFEARVDELLRHASLRRTVFEGSHETEDIRDGSGAVVGRVIREVLPICVDVRLALERIAAPQALHRFRLRVENVTPSASLGAARDEAIGAFVAAVHTFLATRGGAFLSLADPPEWASLAAHACRNERSWPVLVGENGARDVMLASPIILEDYPQIAPESVGDLCDSTEIDEILTLRTMTLTDEEKREARATDARAAAIIDRADTMPQEMLDRLHGTIRYLREVTGESKERSPEAASTELDPWWDPAADASVDPETDAIEIRGTRVAKGTRVKLCPGPRRADAQDMFLEGRAAIVQGVFLDVEDKQYLAVSLEDDPAAELHQWHGRYFYFAPDEVEPLEVRP